jgi:hypothetical protein
VKGQRPLTSVLNKRNARIGVSLKNYRQQYKEEDHLKTPERQHHTSAYYFLALTGKILKCRVTDHTATPGQIKSKRITLRSARIAEIGTPKVILKSTPISFGILQK